MFGESTLPGVKRFIQPPVIAVKPRSGLRIAVPILLAAVCLTAIWEALSDPGQVAYAGLVLLHAPHPPGPDIPAALPTAIDSRSPIAAAASSPPAELHVCSSGCVYTSVQIAVNAAADGDVILVAQGAYTHVQVIDALTQTVYLTKSLTLRGGYATDDWVHSYPLARPTVLDARGLGRVIYIAANVTATVEGFSLTNGAADDPAGISALD